MTREEEIRAVAVRDTACYEHQKYFEQGAQWADQHPCTETLKDFIINNGYVNQDKLILEFITNVTEWIDNNIDKYYTSRHVIPMFRKSDFINGLNKAMTETNNDDWWDNYIKQINSNNK